MSLATSATAVALGTDADSAAAARQRRRVCFSAFLGTTLEYYDFTLYGLLGPAVFDKAFFPHSDPIVATLLVLSIYAVGFLGRPLGGVVFAHYGDRIGRKPMMVIAMATMGLASTAIGLLPTYASVGPLAPALLVLLRIVQGFALGGESAGGPVLATEFAQVGNRGWFVSLVNSGIFVAWILAVFASTTVSWLAPDDMLSWGWRIPFLASVLLVAVGIYMRLAVEESPLFNQSVREHGRAKVPFFELMRVARRPALIVLLAAMAESGSGFFFLVFGYTYALRTLHIPPSTLLQAMLIGNVIALIMTPLFGRLSDVIGRRVTLCVAYAFAGLYTAFAFFPLLKSGSTPLIYLAMITPVAIVSPLSISVVGSFYSEAFPDARLRYTGVGFGRGLGTTLGGGLMPLISASLIEAMHGSLLGPILWLNLICLAAIVAIIMARETRNTVLD